MEKIIIKTGTKMKSIILTFQATCGVTIKERWDDGENDHQDGDKNEKPHIDFSSHLWRILIPSPS